MARAMGPPGVRSLPVGLGAENGVDPLTVGGHPDCHMEINEDLRNSGTRLLVRKDSRRLPGDYFSWR